MAKKIAKGIYHNAQVTIDKSGNLQAISAGQQRTPKQITGGWTARVGAAFGTAYQNTTNAMLVVMGWGTTSPGGSVGSLTVRVDTVNPPVVKIWGNEATATVNGADTGFMFMVPPGGWFEVVAAGAISGVGGWFEMPLTLA